MSIHRQMIDTFFFCQSFSFYLHLHEGLSSQWKPSVLLSLCLNGPCRRSGENGWWSFSEIFWNPILPKCEQNGIVICASTFFSLQAYIYHFNQNSDIRNRKHHLPFKQKGKLLSKHSKHNNLVHSFPFCNHGDLQAVELPDKTLPNHFLLFPSRVVSLPKLIIL